MDPLPPYLQALLAFQRTAEGLHISELALTASQGPPAEGMRAALALRALAEQWEAERVAGARALGWHWAEIARILGVSRQAATKKYRDRSATPAPARSWAPGTYTLEEVEQARHRRELTQEQAWLLSRAWYSGVGREGAAGTPPA